MGVFSASRCYCCTARARPCGFIMLAISICHTACTRACTRECSSAPAESDGVAAMPRTRSRRSPPKRARQPFRVLVAWLSLFRPQVGAAVVQQAVSSVDVCACARCPIAPVYVCAKANGDNTNHIRFFFALFCTRSVRVCGCFVCVRVLRSEIHSHCAPATCTPNRFIASARTEKCSRQLFAFHQKRNCGVRIRP